MLKKIDLNSDLGEHFGQWQLGDDAAILHLVSSANVACGFHAGSPAHLLNTLKAATTQRVIVGAHVSYPDLVGFGRRNMDIASEDLTADVIYQIGALQGLAQAAGTAVRYVKPHGALYNTIAHNERQALAVIDAILAINPGLPLVCLAGSPLVSLAQQKGLKTVSEVFADRAYHSDGTLVSRQQAGAVIHDVGQAAERMLQWVTEGGLISIEGDFTPIAAQSICVHGDTPEAVDMATQIRHLLESQGIVIDSFLSGR
jgi:UPF0271 protein